jgi:proteasome lid subunit RPN8/RPN11
VARHLAIDVPSPARRASVFLNPKGTDVVVLAEDQDRALTLDVLEVQYYRAVNTEASLQDHLIANPGKLRYGRSCRDVSTTMSTSKVAMHAALAAELVQAAVATSAASMTVIRSERGSLAVTPISIEPARCFRQQVGEWSLILDGKLLDRLAALRGGKLPNETGGVLIGHYDLDRKTVYVVDTIPSPPDSAEWPTLYIRGSEGLLAQVQAVGDRTGGQLEYVGEWHSHPDGCPTLPSDDDLLVFAWLTEHLAVAGLPALMAIVGEQGSSSWFVGEMVRAGGWAVNLS